MTKAVVAVPSLHDFYATPHRFSSLGARIVARIAGECGYDTSFHNFPLERGNAVSTELPPSHSHLTPHIIPDECGPVSYFTRYQRFGPSADACAEAILSRAPAVCLISCFAFCYAGDTIELAAALKARNPALRVICGGAGVSVYPQYFIRNPHIDAAFQGEAECGLAGLLGRMRDGSLNCTGLSGVWWKDADGTLHAPPMVAVTTPGQIIPTFGITRRTSRAVYLSAMFTRGCPRQCSFCANRLCHGDGFRAAPLETAINAITTLDIPDIGGKEIRVNLEDDNLLADPAYLFALTDAFHSRFPNVTFYAENGIDYTLLTPQIVDRLAKGGMKQFNLSLASINPGVLASQNRTVHLARYEEILDILHAQAIPSVTYFICGLPGDTPESICRTITYLATQKTLIGISLFYPVPGIPGFTDRAVFDRCDPARCAGSAAYPWTGSLDTRELITAFRLCRFVNLCKKSALSQEERELVGITRKTGRLHTWVRRGSEEWVVEVPGMVEGMVGRVVGSVNDK